MRDDFAKKIKVNLANRVAYVCSNPGCGNRTLGPKDADTGSISVGVASHIKAASVGGPRYDSSQTPLERKSEANGIWLCELCAKRIDTDPQSFPVDLLNQWKELAERKASELLGKPATGHIIHERVYIASGEVSRPQLDISSLSPSGGADGHFLILEIKNDGEAVAKDIECSLIATGFNEAIRVPNSLSPRALSQPVQHEVTGSPFFKQSLNSPRIVLKYKSGDGIVFESSRDIVQKQRADGYYQILTSDKYKDTASYVTVEFGAPHFDSTLQKDGLSESIFIDIPILINNLSTDTLSLELLERTLHLPDGYSYQPFDRGFQGVQKLPGRETLERTLQFHVFINGRNLIEGTNGKLYNENRVKAMRNLTNAPVLLNLKVKSTSPRGRVIVESNFDVTDNLNGKF